MMAGAHNQKRALLTLYPLTNDNNMAQPLAAEQLCLVLEQTLSPVAEVRRNGT